MDSTQKGRQMDQNVLQFVEKYFDSSSEISFLLFWAAVTFLKECPQRASFRYSHGTVYEKKLLKGLLLCIYGSYGGSIFIELGEPFV